MATPAQAAANQTNAQHSTGPITTDGKATSSRNNLRHGFRSATVLLPGDDPAEYETLLAELTEHLDPADLTEERFTREMADAEWRLRRVRQQMESALSRHMAKLAEENSPMNPLHLQSLAVETLGQTGCSYATWLRYETKFERQYDRAYNAWSRYQDVRQRSSKRAADRVLEHVLAPFPGAAPEKSASNVQTPPTQQDPASPVEQTIARNALCPCGSGDKYKRCCGRHAPPVLHASEIQ